MARFSVGEGSGWAIVRMLADGPPNTPTRLSAYETAPTERRERRVSRPNTAPGSNAGAILTAKTGSGSRHSSVPGRAESSDLPLDDLRSALESKRLESGGWPAEARHYTTSDNGKAGVEWVDWGGTSKSKENEWVTVDALAVLQAAGRLRV